MWKRKVGELSFKKNGGGPLSVCLKTHNPSSHFIYRKRDDLTYVLFETHQCLCPISTTVSHTGVCCLSVRPV